MKPACCSMPATSVTEARRTPGIWARNSWVRGNSSPPSKLADHLGVTPRHVRRLIAEPRIPYLKWGRLIRFDPDEIADWLDSTRKKAASPGPGIAAKPGTWRSDSEAG